MYCREASLLSQQLRNTAVSVWCVLHGDRGAAHTLSRLQRTRAGDVQGEDRFIAHKTSCLQAAHAAPDTPLACTIGILAFSRAAGIANNRRQITLLHTKQQQCKGETSSKQ